MAVLNAVSQFAFCFIFSAFSAVMGHADDKEGGRDGNAMDLLLVFMAAEKAINRTKSIFFCNAMCECVSVCESQAKRHLGTAAKMYKNLDFISCACQQRWSRESRP